MSNSKKLWSRFEKSGKLIDYLEYCKARKLERKTSEQTKDGNSEPQSSL